MELLLIPVMIGLIIIILLVAIRNYVLSRRVKELKALPNKVIYIESNPPHKLGVYYTIPSMSDLNHMNYDHRIDTPKEQFVEDVERKLKTQLIDGLDKKGFINRIEFATGERRLEILVSPYKKPTL